MQFKSFADIRLSGDLTVNGFVYIFKNTRTNSVKVGMTINPIVDRLKALNKNNPDKEYFNENSNYKPNSPYSASKASGDHLVRAWNKTFQLPTLTTHCSNNYGPWQFPEKLIPVIISKILKNESIPIYGNGKNLRDWIHVFDHVKALSELINIDFNGQVYNIGSDHIYSNLDLTKKICSIMSQKLNNNFNYTNLIKFVDDRLGHDFKYAIDSSKIRKDLNFSYKYDIDSGLKNTIDWYLLNKEWLLNKIK